MAAINNLFILQLIKHNGTSSIKIFARADLTACGGVSGGIGLPTFNLSTGRGWVIGFTYRSLYPPPSRREVPLVIVSWFGRLGEDLLTLWGRVTIARLVSPLLGHWLAGNNRDTLSCQTAHCVVVRLDYQCYRCIRILTARPVCKTGKNAFRRNVALNVQLLLNSNLPWRDTSFPSSLRERLTNN